VHFLMSRSMSYLICVILFFFSYIYGLYLYSMRYSTQISVLLMISGCKNKYDHTSRGDKIYNRSVVLSPYSLWVTGLVLSQLVVVRLYGNHSILMPNLIRFSVLYLYRLYIDMHCCVTSHLHIYITSFSSFYFYFFWFVPKFDELYETHDVYLIFFIKFSIFFWIYYLNYRKI
jgi:hypothetical protein